MSDPSPTGEKTLKPAGFRETGRTDNANDQDAADADRHAMPDAPSDRAAPGKAQPRKPPLGIKEIETLEDDAKGG